MLTQQLRELGEADLVHREIFAAVPPKVEYALTERGESLRPVLEALAAWGRAADGNPSTSPQVRPG